MESLGQHAFVIIVAMIVMIASLGRIILSTDNDGEIKKSASEGFLAMVERLTKPKS